MDSENIHVEFSDGEISLAVHDGGSIHIRALTAFGDPVELNSAEAKELGEKLLELARLIE